jgi:hypothetical protein
VPDSLRIPGHPVTGAWMSKAPSEASAPMTNLVLAGNATGTAHFVVNGKPLCASQVLRDGRPMFAPFLCGWRELRTYDRKCKYCERARIERRDAAE